MAILGKESWGGMSVGEGENVGLELIGWDSLEVSRSGAWWARFTDMAHRRPVLQ
jgi:hypothetical protein